jgi:hypothetical protein
MRIAIIDSKNQDIGLKIVFPEADYYVKRIEFPEKIQNMNYYTIHIHYDWSTINDTNYDYVFIICALYNAYQPDDSTKSHFNQEVKDHLSEIETIVNQNNFKFVGFFDNYDFDYDPASILPNPKINLFFKRNYSKLNSYASKVIPFPFIMFGYNSLIERMDKELVSEEEYLKIKNERVFFTGGLYDKRIAIYNEIKDTIYNPGPMQYSTFIHTLRNSKFSLDLLGIGDPNMRTFEILLSGSLLVSQKNMLHWPFPEEFSKETQFETKEEYSKQLTALKTDPVLYNTCLTNQYNIVKKYMNKAWIRKYILNTIQLYTN